MWGFKSPLAHTSADLRVRRSMSRLEAELATGRRRLVQTVCYRGSGNERGDSLGRVLLERGNRVRVRVECEPDGRVAEEIAHDLRVHTRGERHRGEAVAEVVEPNLGKLGLKIGRASCRDRVKRAGDRWTHAAEWG